MAKKPRALGPWAPAEYSKADVAAIQALDRGDATPDQQKRALDWIINACAAAYDMSYRPGGEEGRRDSDFAEGKRHVGNQIVKLTKINISTVFKEPNG